LSTYKKDTNHYLKNRFKSIEQQIKILSSLRKSISLPPSGDITERQWSVIEAQLVLTETQLLSRLKKIGRKYLPHVNEIKPARFLNYQMGKIELDLSRSFRIFDTFLDILSQRHLPEIGLILTGCDVLALDAIRKNHSALSIVEPPVVYFDRGFGAAILREGVLLQDNIKNPLPTIQIPYSKLKVKHGTVSIIHEAGHVIMVRLGLVSSLPKAIKSALGRVGAPDFIKELFALWMGEIGPDFWSFCNCGIAQTSSTMEILSLPKQHVFRVPPGDPHPPPYLRVLLSIKWCHQLWGRGNWDKLERKWLELYPLENASKNERKILETGKKYLNTVTRTLFNTKFHVLNWKTIPSLFDLNAISPSNLERIIRSATSSGTLNLTELSPCAQLAVFRLIKDKGSISEQTLDRIMTMWLVKLGKTRKE